MSSPLDPSSLANLDAWATQHLDINLAASFEQKKLHGYVVLRMKALKGSNQVVLDTRDIKISGARIKNSNVDLKFNYGEMNEAFGQALHIHLGNHYTPNSIIELQINYETSVNASGLQWLPPAQTEGKKYPYLFSQFQSVHCRSAIPCQDSPVVKATYTAQVTVPKPLVCLMSAVPNGTRDAGDSTVYLFEQKVPIPSYLIAIVAAHLVSKDIGPRTRVWTEESRLDACAWEFAETESFVATGENLLTPYVWGRYDLLVLPGSFPYGGMENPCLTFVTPTLLAGDRSLVSVVAHEIAHSWTGNLVTNKNWEHFWMNEGFTVFVERKIISRIYGEKMRHLAAIEGSKSLADSIELFGKDHEFTKLVQNLTGVDPDESYSSVAYEKGFQFLFYLESVVGIERFETFLREWVKLNAYQTIVSDDFKAFFIANFGSNPEIISKVDWDAWLHAPGYPPVDVNKLFDTSLSNAANALANKWLKENGNGCGRDDIKGWNTLQTCVFLGNVEDGNTTLSIDTLKKMDEYYNLTKSRNAEIRFSWYSICIKSEYEEVFPYIVQFLKEQGRMKYVRPLYRALYKSVKGKQLALDTFMEWRENYHNIAQKMIAKDLGLESQKK